MEMNRSHAPSSTLVTSGDSIGSGGAEGDVPFVDPTTNAERSGIEASLTASLTIDPLNPTMEMPTMTVTRESHLAQRR